MRKGRKVVDCGVQRYCHQCTPHSHLFFLGIQEDTAPWQEVVVGLLILLLFVTPVVALRAIAGGEETEQEG